MLKIQSLGARKLPSCQERILLPLGSRCTAVRSREWCQDSSCEVRRPGETRGSPEIPGCHLLLLSTIGHLTHTHPFYKPCLSLVHHNFNTRAMTLLCLPYPDYPGHCFVKNSPNSLSSHISATPCSTAKWGTTASPEPEITPFRLAAEVRRRAGLRYWWDSQQLTNRIWGHSKVPQLQSIFSTK